MSMSIHHHKKKTTNGNDDVGSEVKDEKATRGTEITQGVRSHVFRFMDLPTAIIHHIFFLVPMNSIIQCKRVCKAWKNLLSDSSFTTNYLRNTPFKLTLWLCPRYGRGSFSLLEIADNGRSALTPMHDIIGIHSHQDSKIIGSRNGLTCVLLTGSRLSEQIYLINLINGHDQPIIKLPENAFYRPGAEKSVYQFGFSASANKFKVVRFALREEILDENFERIPKYEIFTVEEDSDWRYVKEDSVLLSSRLEAYVTFNGVVHWVNEPLWNISTFDLGEEKGGQISLPYNLGIHLNMMKLKVLNDHLSLVDYRDKSEITIWTMKEYPIHKSWTKDYVISLTGFPSDLRSFLYYGTPSVVTTLPTGDILLYRVNGRRPMCYSPQRTEWTDLDILPAVDWDRYVIA